MATILSSSAGSAPKSQETYVCPFPRSWYPSDSPCSQSDKVVTGSTQDPWISPKAAVGSSAASPKAGTGPSAAGSSIKTLGLIALGITVVYLAIRGMEAYGTIKSIR